MLFQAAFLLKSPLQFLNALEACHHYELDRRACLLVIMADRKSLSQMQELLQEEGGWGGVFFLHRSGARLRIASEDVVRAGSEVVVGGVTGSAPFGLFKLRRLAKSVQSLKKVFVGDVGNPLMRHFVNLANPCETLALDDGTATLEYARSRAGRGSKRGGKRFSKRFKMVCKRVLLGMRDERLSLVTFFSVYDLAVAAPDRFERCDYSYLRTRASELKTFEGVFFLGSPLVEAEVLTEDELFWHLSKVSVQLGSIPVLYVAHRRECADRLQRIHEMTGWDVEKFAYPIEYQLAIKGPYPQILASFSSSALENCRLLFGSRLYIRVFRFNPKFFAAGTGPKGQGYHDLFDYYKARSSDTFRVTDL